MREKQRNFFTVFTTQLLDTRHLRQSLMLRRLSAAQRRAALVDQPLQSADKLLPTASRTAASGALQWHWSALTQNITEIISILLQYQLSS
ncbi:hypothetical protein E2C01_050950 [Portunus trituberculatus]|uniref:Uncharacterized protein n=1 Tax=Portunus trituberculatus TaxID=210409 RepID=A0A5B7GDG7_PORTR|nr:hypothetical protein [Portunus trituberculatus]